MKKVVSRQEGFVYAVAVVAILAILTIFPLRLWHEDIVSTSNQVVAGSTGVLRDTKVASQMFVTQYDHLDSISLYITEGEAGDILCLRVFEDTMRNVREQVITLPKDFTAPGFVDVTLNLDTKVSKEYHYTVEGIKGAITLGQEVTETSGSVYNGPAYYGEEPLVGNNLISEYHYGQPLRKQTTIFAVLAIALITFLFQLFMKLLSKKWNWLNELVTMEWILKVIMNPIIAISCIGMMIAVGPFHLFGKRVLDIVVLELGILLTGVTLIYAVNHKRTGEESFLTKEYIKREWKNWLQSACFALGLWACINYMNGFYEVFHDIGYRQMLLALGLSMIVTFGKKEIMNWYMPLTVAASAAAGYFHYQKYLPQMEDEYHAEVLRLTAYLVVIVSVVTVNIIVSLFKRKVRLTKVHWFYFICTAVISAGVIIQRNTRWWPVMMIVAFSLYGIRMAAWSGRSALLMNICRGVIFHFISVMAYCLWHRPYVYYKYTRYSGAFFTVTETASYLAMVLAAAAVLLFVKWNKTRKLSLCYKEMILFGIITAYLLFTMSRTGLLGIGVAGIVLWCVMLSGKWKEKLIKMASAAGMIVLVVLWCFPITYAAQRMVPAMVAEPKLFEYEHYFEDILVGNKPDSQYYIGFGKFMDQFFYKMIGTEENTFDHLDEIEFGKAEITAFAGKQVASVRPGAGIVYSIDDEARFDYGNGADGSFDNGRSEIFRSYYNQMTKDGHDEMGALLEDGSLAVHAHNIYLQVAFDHGIIIGIGFVIWMLLTVLYAAYYYYKNRHRDQAAAMPLAIAVVFAATGLVEWISHPCNPSCFVLLLVLMPLLYEISERCESDDRNF